MLHYNDLFAKIESEGEQRQVFAMLRQNVKYDSKVQKELQVLSKTADMTTNFFKNKAKKEVSEENQDMDHKNKTKDVSASRIR